MKEMYLRCVVCDAKDKTQSYTYKTNALLVRYSAGPLLSEFFYL